MSNRPFLPLSRQQALPGTATLCSIALVALVGTSVAVGAEKAQAFVDITKQAGISFTHTFGDTKLTNILEATGPGCAVLDFDGDGFMDLYLVSGTYLEGISDPQSKEDAAKPKPINRLYRNNGNDTFTDVTTKAGVGDPSYSIGAVVADYDNDGDQDLYVTNYGPNILYRNNGDGTFTDVTAKAGVAGPETLKEFRKWSLHGSFFDYDKDGWLDLYVANYLAFDPEYNLYFKPDGFPGPLSYEGQPDILYHNNGDGTFTDVSQKTGIFNADGRAMSVSVSDFDNDGDGDIFVSNDAMENFLFRNNGDGTFTEQALELGVAFGEFGESTSSMAPAFADLDNDGDLDLFVPDMGFSCLYRNDLPILFGITAKAGIAAVSGQYTSWAPVMLDYDNDSWVDIFITNGDAHHLYTEEDLLLRNKGNLTFEDVSLESGDYFAKDEYVGRGAAKVDIDNDGDLDILVMNVGGPAILLRNELHNANHWLIVRTVGKISNRDGVGARVKLTSGKVSQIAEVVAGAGYLSTNDPRLHFGLGPRSMVDQLEITWPSGAVQKLSKVKVDRILTVTEPTK